MRQRREGRRQRLEGLLTAFEAEPTSADKEAALDAQADPRDPARFVAPWKGALVLRNYTVGGERVTRAAGNWAANDMLVEVFAINSTHWNDCDGGGPRLVWQNEGLIREWMRWEPTLAQKIDAGCFEWEIRLFPDLLDFFNDHPARLLGPNAGAAWRAQPGPIPDEAASDAARVLPCML